jgi:dihydropteroate synthase
VKPVIKELSGIIDKPISIDTRRSKVAEEAVKAGASIINDTSGFKSDPNIAKIAGEYGTGVVLVAYGKVYYQQDPIVNVRRLLRESIDIALDNGVKLDDIIVDPGIGFFRNTYIPWYEWDTYILRNLHRLSIIKRPILVGVSRKSFIGEILGIKDPKYRSYGSIASEAIAVYNGADMIRTHNVRETRDAVRMAEYIRGKRFKKVSGYGVDIIDITSLYKNIDLIELMTDMNVIKEGAEIMSKKGVYKLIYIRNIPKLLSIIVKEEMLSACGDVATSKDAIFSGFEPTDIIILGSLSSIDKLIKKLNMMSFESLRKRGLIDSRELASLIEEVVK